MISFRYFIFERQSKSLGTEAYILPLRVADAVNEGLDLRILLDGLIPVPRIGVLGCLVLELIGGAVVDVLVDALAGLAPEEVGVLVVLTAPAGETSSEGDFGNEPEHTALVFHDFGR